MEQIESSLCSICTCDGHELRTKNRFTGYSPWGLLVGCGVVVVKRTGYMFVAFCDTLEACRVEKWGSLPDVKGGSI